MDDTLATPLSPGAATVPPRKHPRRRTRVFAALRRVLVAPGFVLAIWVANLLAAKLLAGPGRAAARAGMRDWTWFDDGHRIRAVVELLADEPAIAAAISSSVVSAAVVAGIFSLLAAPAILTRLDGQRSLAWIVGAVGRELPAMLVQTGYSLVIRAVCLGLAGACAAGLGPRALPLILLLVSFPVLALDRARAAVVLDDARPYHPMTMLRAVGHVALRPLWWLSGTVIETLKLGVVIAALLLLIEAGPSPISIWVARAAGLAAVILSLWRVALAVEDRGANAP
ncbi:hypothetical protein DB30_01165 [Enhygromyxa salina]|uniref:Uncharacterized protein n=1 Tax=Enhygromyxa salina TaxID=215803 RepID=A0A0C2CXX2_9BACT|nr:hypothetical protein [Enhygromyxa salina]KIG12677.1 hypothetical protein DB30_01165 [Enhygromyxa salina]